METNTSDPEVKAVAFAGSLRNDSYNKALLRATKELAPEKLRVNIHDIADIPLFNQDVEQKGYPEPVVGFKKAIEQSDVLLVATPEYNYGVTGVTKNAIDWASRPPNNSPLDEKPVGIIGASPSITGTARSQSQLRNAFRYTNSYCMPQPEVLVNRANKKFDDDGKLTDDKTRDFLGDFLEKLYRWTLKFVKK